jgi:hypothetical protein
MVINALRMIVLHMEDAHIPALNVMIRTYVPKTLVIQNLVVFSLQFLMMTMTNVLMILAAL